MYFFCFLLFWESYNYETIGTIQVDFSAKRTSPNEDSNQIELIPLDRITYFKFYVYSDCFLCIKFKYSECSFSYTLLQYESYWYPGKGK